MTDIKTSDRDVNRAIRSWLHEDRHEDASRIAGAVLDRVETTQGRRASWPAWRTPIMNKFAMGLGAAAAVVLAVAAFNLLPGSPPPGSGPSPTAQPSAAERSPVESSPAQPTAAVSSTDAPTATPAPSSAPLSLLPEGEHLLWNGGTFGAEVMVTIAAPDWYGETTSQSQRRGILRKDNSIAAPDGAGLMIFGASTLLASPADTYIYGDPCHWESTKPDAAVATVDEAVAALSSQTSREVSAPVDVSVSGHAGKSITLTVPDDALFADCDRGEYRTAVQAYFSEETVLVAQDPGQIDKLWILDAEGDLLILAASYHDATPQSVVDELDDIVANATINAP